MSEDEKMLSVSKAAKRLGVHPETIRRWIRLKKVKASRYPGGQFKIAETDVQRILDTAAVSNHQQP